MAKKNIQELTFIFIEKTTIVFSQISRINFIPIYLYALIYLRTYERWEDQ